MVTPSRSSRLPERAAATTAPADLALVARLPGGDLPYLLRRSPRSRRLRVTVDPLRGVIASVPLRTGEARARALVEPFLAEREQWLRRHLRRDALSRGALGSGSVDEGAIVPYLGMAHRLRFVDAAGRPRRSRVERVGGDVEDELVLHLATGDRRSPAAVLEAWFRVRARAAVDAALAQHAAALGVSPVAVTVRDPRSRWGSASRAGRLMFAWRLVLAPPVVLETVVVHELCHLRAFGHGPRFWALVAGRVPDHARHRRWLRDHAAALHGALGGPVRGRDVSAAAGSGDRVVAAVERR